MIELYKGDCLEVMATLDPESVDALITDPPYGIDYQSYRSADKTKRTPKIAGDGQPYVWFLPQTYRLLRQDRSGLVFCRWDTAEAFRLAMGWAGFRVRGQVVWDRGWHGMGDLATTFAPQHDLIWHANKGRHALSRPRPKSVVSVRRVAAQHLTHPNEKPVELMEQLICAVTNPGDVVLDPFMGSGTTGEACVRTGRGFVGIELADNFFNIAKERIEHVRAKSRLSVP